MGGMADSLHSYTSRRSLSDAHGSSAASEDLFRLPDTLLLNTVNQKGYRELMIRPHAATSAEAVQPMTQPVGHGQTIARWRRMSKSGEEAVGLLC